MADKKPEEDVIINVKMGSKTFIKVVIAVILTGGVITGLLAGNGMIVRLIQSYLGIKVPGKALQNQQIIERKGTR